MSAFTPLAVVSMACRLPDADNLSQYWDLIREGGTAIRELPDSRLDQRLYFDPEKGKVAKTYSRIGGVVSERTQAPKTYHLSEDEIRCADPAHLELVDVAGQAINSAGWDPMNLQQFRTGTFIGHTRGTGLSGDLVYRTMVGSTAKLLHQCETFQQITGEHSEEIVDSVVKRTRDRYASLTRPGHYPKVEAYQAGALLRSAFQLDGPFMALNAACASSLYALSAASMALTLGEIDIALVGGASYCKVDSLILFSKAESVSATGSRPFDNEADGFATAEGYVILAIKTLESAVKSGDPIQAVIRGIGFASDGKGKSLWAPRQEGQVAAIQRAYGDSVRMDRIQYIEAHATSTPVGDATEVSALAQGLKGKLRQGQVLPIGSVKANVGHTLETAGMAGLVKTILAIQHKTIPPVPNLKEPNAKIDWASTPFVLPGTASAWPEQWDGSPRRAGVNSFGIGGLNAHVVIDEYRKDWDYYESEIPKVSVKNRSIQTDAMMQPLAIIGRSALLPDAQTWDAFWENCMRGHCAIRKVPSNRFDMTELALDVESIKGGYLHDYRYDWRKHKVPPKQVEGADPLQFMLLDAVDQALRDSGYRDSNPFALRTGMVVGSIFGGEFGNQLQMGMRLPEFLDDLDLQLQEHVGHRLSPSTLAGIHKEYSDLLLKQMPALLDETGSFTSSTLASRCTKTFDWMGGATAIDAGNASGLAAVHLASMMLRTFQNDVMVVAAGQRSAGLTRFHSLLRRSRLARGDDYNPLFRSEGTYPAEGVAVMILKRLEDAERDGDRIHAVLHSIGVASSIPFGDCTFRAIQRSLASISLRSEDIGLVEASEDGECPSQNVLESILEALDGSANKDLSPLNPSQHSADTVHLRDVAESLGSLGGAGGLVAALRASESVKQSLVPPRVCERTDERIGRQRRFVASPSPMSLKDQEGAESSSSSAIAISSHGGELTYAAVLSSLSNAKRTRIVNAPRIEIKSRLEEEKRNFTLLAFGAPTVSEILSKLEALRDPFKYQRLKDIPLEHAFAPSDSFRLAFLVESPDELPSKLSLASRGLEMERNLGQLANQGIFFGSTREAQKNPLALLFPGQGSQYPNMFRGQIESDPSWRSCVDSVDEILSGLGMPSVWDIFVEESELLGKDLFRTQASVLLANTMMYRQLQNWNLTPNYLLGHSFGEFSAFLASGVWELSTALQATQHRCQSIESASLPQASMISLFTSEERAIEVIHRFPGQAWIANLNSPEQSVIGVRSDAIPLVVQHAKEKGIRSTILKVPAAFHTPLMESAQPIFAEAISHLELNDSNGSLLSSVSGKFETKALRLRACLISQLTAPVPFVRCVQDLYGRGCRLFLEVGPNQVLTGLVRRILADRDDCLVVAMDDPRRGTKRGLLSARAALAVNGLLQDSPHGQTMKESPCICTSESSTFMTKSYSSFPTDRIPEPDTLASLTPSTPQPASGISLPPSLLHREQEMIVLQGTRREMGRTFGEIQRTQIIELLTRCVGMFGETRSKQMSGDLGSSWAALQDVQVFASVKERYWHQEDLEELQGISEGSGVSIDNLLALNHWLYPDMGAGCSHFVVRSIDCGGGLLHGANEDIPFGLTLRTHLPRAICLRKPSNGLAHVMYPVAGQVGSLSGINERGISISSSMLLNLPSANHSDAGILHGLLVAKLLSSSSCIDEVLQTLSDQRIKRRGAWGMLVSDHAASRLLYMEYHGDDFASQFIEANHWISTNHSRLLPCHSPISHSVNRFNRLQKLLPSGSQGFTSEDALLALRDQFCDTLQRVTPHPTMNTVRRVDHQASVLFDSGRKLLWTSTSDSSTSQTGHSDLGFSAIRLSEFGFMTRSEKKSSLTIESAKTAQDDKLPVKAPIDDRKGRPVSPWVIDPQSFIAKSTKKPEPSTFGPENICERFELRLVPKSLVSSEESSFPRGGVLAMIFDSFGELFCHQLAASGVDTRTIRIDQTSAFEEVLQSLEKDSPESLPRHCLVIAPREKLSNMVFDSYERDRNLLLEKCFPLIQRWYSNVLQHGKTNESSFRVCVSMGGDFGLSGTLRSAADAALVGLAKAIRLETRVQLRDRFGASIVDLGGSIPDRVACHLLMNEWRMAPPEVEVAYDHRGDRYALIPIVQNLSPSQTPTPIKSNPGAWLITGGGRGVTAAVAEELAQHASGTLHLIGSTDLSLLQEQWLNLNSTELKELRSQEMKRAIQSGEVPAERWGRIERALEIGRNLDRFRRDGVPFRYWNCDVSNEKALRNVIEQIRTMGEPIVGVIHGAGFERATKFSTKKPEFVRKTVAVKVDGCVGLMKILQGDPLQRFVIFGSISGRFGGVGQVDYCLANEMVAKLGCWYRALRPDVRVVTLAWHSWDEVGMAVRPETKHAKVLANMRFMSVKEGVKHLIDELNANTQAADVTITDWKHYANMLPEMRWDEEDLTSTDTSPTPTSDAGQLKSPLIEEKNAASNNVAKRYLLKSVEFPLLHEGAFRLGGTAVVLGANPAAHAVTQLLRSRGLQVIPLSLNEAAKDISEFESMLEEHIPEHLILANGRDEEATYLYGSKRWNARLENSLQATFAIVQKWMIASKKKEVPVSTLSAFVSLGGDFGIENRPASYEGGALCGLLKSIKVERNGDNSHPVRIKVIDASHSYSPEALAKHLLQELESDDPYVEVAWHDSQRRLISVIDAPLLEIGSHLPQAKSVWVAAGGGRGITSKVAIELARRFDLSMHLLGRTPLHGVSREFLDADDSSLPNMRERIAAVAKEQGKDPRQFLKEIKNHRELHQNLSEAKRLGLEIHYHNCDVCDRASVAEVFNKIRASYGPIQGVLQGAGATFPDRFENKQLGRVRTVMDVKLTATKNLIEITRQDPIQYFIGFGSISGRTGANGGTDYAMCSEGMCKLINSLRHERKDVRAFSIHWTSWGGAGMMLQPTSFGGRSIMKLNLMPVEEGIGHLVREMSQEVIPSEVVIGEDSFFIRTNHPLNLVPAGMHDASQETKAQSVQTPLLTLKDTTSQNIYDWKLDSVQDPFLSQHLLKSKPTMPLVVSIEAMLEAARATSGSTEPISTLRDISVKSQLNLEAGETLTCQVSAHLKKGEWETAVEADFLDRRGKLVQRNRPRVTAHISFSKKMETASPPQVEEAIRWHRAMYLDDEVIYHGNAFRTLKYISPNRDDIYGILEAPDPMEILGSRTGKCQSPMALLDGCLFACGVLLWISDPTQISIPTGIDWLQIARIPRQGERLFLHVEKQIVKKMEAELSFQLWDESRQPLLLVKGYRSAFLRGANQPKETAALP